MARRIIGLTLAAALVLSLTGCGGAKARLEETASDDSIISAPGNIVVGENSGETASKTNSSTSGSPLGDLITEITTESIENRLSKANVKDYVTLGHYEQDGNLHNGGEEIEWMVLFKRNDSMLLLSKYILDIQPFHASLREIDYADSTLRIWVEHNFYDNAFSEQEKSLIHTAPLILEERMIYQYLGEIERDSHGSETYSYRHNDTKAQLTEFAISQYINARMNTGETEEEATANYEEWIKPKDNYHWWWAGSMTADKRFPVYVGSDGNVNIFNSIAEVTTPLGGVRPAIWVSINVDPSANNLGVIRDSVDGDITELCKRCNLELSDYDNWIPEFAMSEEMLVDSINKLRDKGCSVIVIEAGIYTPPMDMLRSKYPSIEFILPEE